MIFFPLPAPFRVPNTIVSHCEGHWHPYTRLMFSGIISPAITGKTSDCYKAKYQNRTQYIHYSITAWVYCLMYSMCVCVNTSVISTNISQCLGHVWLADNRNPKWSNSDSTHTVPRHCMLRVGDGGKSIQHCIAIFAWRYCIDNWTPSIDFFWQVLISVICQCWEQPSYSSSCHMKCSSFHTISTVTTSTTAPSGGL